MLRREQIDAIVSIWLIEPDDISPRRIISIFELNRTLRARDFDVLAHQPRDHSRDSRWIPLILRNEEGVRCLRQALLPRIPRFLVEVAQHVSRVSGSIVECDESAGFLIVEIVASRPSDLMR